MSPPTVISRAAAATATSSAMVSKNTIVRNGRNCRPSRVS